ncbi:MAG TPA: M48 family metallopeptidase [Thermoanaerobaculia bacterium]|nr:M48 family metallopeptidase [Thermoanaerobaculia bacterium]
MKRIVLVSLVAIGVAVIAARVVSAQTPAPEERSGQPERPIEVPADPNAPVPVPEPSEKALRYHRTGNVLWAVGILWGIVVPLALLFSGFSAHIRDVARRIGKKWFFTVAIFAILFTIVSWVIDLPLAYYTGFARQHEYGLSNQTQAKWWSDALKGLMVSVIMTPLVLWIPYLLLRKSPKRWWLWTGLASIPLIILLLLVSPIWIAPLFNEFGPMKDKALEQDILNLAQRAGIEGSRVFEVEKSVDTKAVNAYVTGFAETKRIVLWDTIIAKLDRDELLFVMGHEMGHFVLGHVLQIIAIASALVIIGLWAVHVTAAKLIERHQKKWGFTELSDVASLPLMGLLFGIATFVLTPAVLMLTRHNEHESDRFGLEITRNNRAAAVAFIKLQEENLGVPRPGTLYKIWRSSHPPIGERIDFINSYKPWETGQPLRYEEKFQGPAPTP